MRSITKELLCTLFCTSQNATPLIFRWIGAKSIILPMLGARWLNFVLENPVKPSSGLVDSYLNDNLG